MTEYPREVEILISHLREKAYGIGYINSTAVEAKEALSVWDYYRPGGRGYEEVLKPLETTNTVSEFKAAKRQAEGNNMSVRDLVFIYGLALQALQQHEVSKFVDQAGKALVREASNVAEKVSWPSASNEDVYEALTKLAKAIVEFK